MILDIEINGEFLELDNLQITIEQTNNMFTDGIAPEFFSYPFEVAPTEKNLRLLKSPNLTDNVLKLADKLPIKVYLRKQFWLNALLTIDRYTSRIEAHFVPTVTDTFNSFLEKTLQDLDYGDYNSYLLPEAQPYQLIHFAISSGNTIGIQVDSHITMSDLYTTPWNTSAEQTVLDFVNAVNADTPTKDVTARVITHEIISSVDHYYILFYSFNFDIEGFRLIANPSSIAYTTIMINDVYTTATPEARHMEYVDKHVNTGLNLYEKCFGKVHWRFPIIYNPSFWNGDPVKYNNFYDNFINTYLQSADKYLERYNLTYLSGINTVASTSPANWTLPYQQPCCPQPKLSWVLNNVVKNFGFTLNTNFFNEAELDNLLMLNLFHQSARHPDDAVANNISPLHFEFKKSVPGITANEFLSGFKNTFAQFFYFDFKQNTLEIKSANEIHASTEIIDITSKVILSKITEQGLNNTMKLSYIFDSNDAFPKSDIQPISEYKLKAQVNLTSGLPTTIPPNEFSDIRLVYKDNQFQLVSNEPTLDRWEFRSENLHDYETGATPTEVKATLAPVLMIRNPKRYVYGVQQEGTHDPVFTPFDPRNTSFLCPKVSQPGNSAIHRHFDYAWAGRLMFYRGSVADFGYVFANYDIWDKDYNQVGEYSLKWTGAEGVVSKFWQSHIDFVSNCKKKISLQADFDHIDLINFKIYKKHRFENTNFLINRLKVTIDNSKDTIDPTLLECYK